MWVIYGSHPDCSVGQWVKWVNRCDPLSTLMHICDVICGNLMLEVLDISSTHLQKVGAAEVFNALTNNKSLQVLNASHNQIDDAAVDNLTRSLSNNVALQDIRLLRYPIY